MEHMNNEKRKIIKIHDKSDVIKIRLPLNVWKTTSIILGLALIIMIFLYFQGKGFSDKVSPEDAGEKIVAFLNSKADGNVNYISSEDLGNIYEVTVSYLGQEIPVYVTKDGKYFVQTVVPLSEDTLDSLNEQNSNEVTNIEASEDDDPVLGNKNAKITIIEFSDYECPFCLKFYEETLPQLKKEYIDTGKAKLIYRDFPLDIHPNAQKAAEAAECAGEQSDKKYWEMHNKLFENQNALDSASLKKYAEEINLETNKFDDCLDSGKMKQEVLKDTQDGYDYRISGTPTFYINGKVIEGAQPFSVFKQIIDEELKK